MKFVYRGIWRYTWQMIALLVIASVAIHSTVTFLEDQIANPPTEGPILPFGTLWVFWAMVVGFMFLVGGLSLWTLQFATESESLRRVGNLVDAMKMIKDALVSLDTKGRLTGSNPTAARNPTKSNACSSRTMPHEPCVFDPNRRKAGRYSSSATSPACRPARNGASNWPAGNSSAGSPGGSPMISTTCCALFRDIFP